MLRREGGLSSNRQDNVAVVEGGAVVLQSCICCIRAKGAGLLVDGEGSCASAFACTLTHNKLHGVGGEVRAVKLQFCECDYPLI